MIIFGASGDLTRRKLVPALLDLHCGGHLPQQFALLGVSRSTLSDEEFRRRVIFENEFLESGLSPDAIQSFSKKLFYQPIDTLDAASYRLLSDRMNQLETDFQTRGNCIFYLSTPPSLYPKIPECLAAHQLNRAEGTWRRLVIEKPFGSDLESARRLNRELKSYFDEEQIYRIDHYLGKETVQNLLVTRFANSIFEPLWNHQFIDYVEITSAEPMGVGTRGGYYDQSGALRDMLQNHLMQIVAHVAMEPPIANHAEAIRSEKAKLFRSLRPIAAEDVHRFAIRGQYMSSNIRSELVKGYRDEEGVPENSKTETFAALEFYIDNWRWSDVPFYIRTGKRLPTKVTEVTITFKKPPHRLFRTSQQLAKPVNQMVIRIQPDEGIVLKFGMKVPGDGFEVKDVGMDFHYADLASKDVVTAYERLLLDCMKGDATLYAHGDSVEYCWEFVEPILSAWANDPTIKIFGYPAGSWGPDIADEMIRGDSGWRNPCRNLTSDDSYCEL